MRAKKITLLGILTLTIIILLMDVFMFKFISHTFRTKSEIHQLKDDSGFVDYRKVTPKRSKLLKGTIFIFPPTGGENIIDRLYAGDLALQGFEVFILQKWTGYEIEGIKYELHNVFYGSAQTALNKVMKLASTSTFGILGTSVGALHTSVALTVNAKLKAGFMIVGGLPIPEVIVDSDQKAMTDLKAKRYELYSLKNDEEYLKNLSEVFELEPTAQAVNNSTGKIIGAIVSENDVTVPSKNQMKALEFFKPSEVYNSDLNHKNTIILFGFMKRKRVITFFEKNL